MIILVFRERCNCNQSVVLALDVTSIAIGCNCHHAFRSFRTTPCFNLRINFRFTNPRLFCLYLRRNLLVTWIPIPKGFFYFTCNVFFITLINILRLLSHRLAVIKITRLIIYCAELKIPVNNEKTRHKLCSIANVLLPS